MHTSVRIMALLCLISTVAMSQGEIELTVRITAEGESEWNGVSLDTVAASVGLYKNGIQHGASQPTPAVFYIDRSTTYTLEIEQERLGIGGDTLKHHLWNGVLSDFKLRREFTTASDEESRSEVADFKRGNPVTVYNNFEEHNDGGSLRIRDPWYLDQAGDQLDSLYLFSSPHTPPGAYGEISGVAFLRKAVSPSNP